MVRTMSTANLFSQSSRAASRAPLACLLLLVACTRNPETKSVDPAPQATAEAVLAEPQQPPAAPPPVNEPVHAEPTAPLADPTPTAAPAPDSAATPSPERALFDIIVRLVKEPAALAELAPDAKIEIHGVKDVKKHKITDAKAELGWLFDEEHAQFAPPGTRLIDIQGTAIRCDATALTCKVGYGGGETDFTFARHADKVVLSKVLSQLN